jgi:hypothetical protein
MAIRRAMAGDRAQTHLSTEETLNQAIRNMHDIIHTGYGCADPERLLEYFDIVDILCNLAEELTSNSYVFDTIGWTVTRTVLLADIHGPFKASPFYSDDGPTEEYGLWFDNGHEYDWVMDCVSLTEEQAVELAKQVNAALPRVRKLDDISRDDFELIEAMAVELTHVCTDECRASGCD